MGKNPGPFLHVEVPNIMFRLMVPKNANMINKTFKTILDIITNHYGSLKKLKLLSSSDIIIMDKKIT